jgi:hypothetical protein
MVCCSYGLGLSLTNRPSPFCRQTLPDRLNDKKIRYFPCNESDEEPQLGGFREGVEWNRLIYS